MPIKLKIPRIIIDIKQLFLNKQCNQILLFIITSYDLNKNIKSKICMPIQI